jgi:hypothetical protein
MTRTIELTEEQKKLFSEAFALARQAATEAEAAVDFANMRGKAFEDLVSMFCASNKLDKAKIKLDPQTWTVLHEDEKTLSI